MASKKKASSAAEEHKTLLEKISDTAAHLKTEIVAGTTAVIETAVEKFGEAREAIKKYSTKSKPAAKKVAKRAKPAVRKIAKKAKPVTKKASKKTIKKVAKKLPAKKKAPVKKTSGRK